MNVASIMQELEKKAQETKEKRPYIEENAHKIKSYSSVDMEDVDSNLRFLHAHFDFLYHDPHHSWLERVVRFKEKLFLMLSRPFLQRQVTFNSRLVRFCSGLVRRFEDAFEENMQPIYLPSQGLPRFDSDQVDISLSQSFVLEHGDYVQRASLDHVIHRIHPKIGSISLNYVLEQIPRKVALSFLQRIGEEMNTSTRLIVYAKHSGRMENIQECRHSACALFSPETLSELGQLAGLQVQEVLFSDDVVHFEKTRDVHIDSNFSKLESLLSTPRYFAVIFVAGK